MIAGIMSIVIPLGAIYTLLVIKAREQLSSDNEQQEE